MISRRTFLIQAGILGAGAAGAWWLREHVVWPKPTAAFADGADSSGWLAFSADQPRLVIVPVQINGRAVHALLDSGAQSSVIDRDLARRLDLSLSPIAPVVAFGVSGQAQVGRSASADVSIGALSFKGLTGAVLDIGSIASASGRKFELVLGQDVFRTVIADVDFLQGRVALHDPARYALPLEAVEEPARLGRGELLVPIRIEGRPIEVVLDTGASGALALSPQTAMAAGLLDGRPVHTAPSITFGGLSHDRMVRARTVTFADHDHRDVRVHVYEPAKGAAIPAGLLGAEILERYRVILDLRRGRLFLISSRSPRSPAEPRR